MIEIKKLSFSYQNKKVLQDLSLAIESQEIVALIGVSGTGKSTLLHLLTGLLPLQQGILKIAGDAPPQAYQHVSYMMQEDLLLPWRTVLKNMTLTAELGRKTKNHPKINQEALLLLNEMELCDCANHYPDQLSGGMRQRVSLARALLQQRPILLLDEPFASLDVVLREKMHLLLRKIQKKYGATIVLVTHDFRDAMSLANRILLMQEGTISQEWKIKEEERHSAIKMGELHAELRQALLKDS